MATMSCPEVEENSDLPVLYTKLMLIILEMVLEREKIQQLIHDPSNLVELAIYRNVRWNSVQE
jgi:hypothetical protein